jgi:hypothetical protein
VILMENILIELIKETENELEMIREKATLFRDSSPGKDAIMAQVDSLEARLARLQESKEEISKILKSHGVETIKDLHELNADHENTLRVTGNKIWQQLVFARGDGKYGADCRVTWLPSDLVALPEFKKMESQARKQLDVAKAALPKVLEDLKTINVLVDEAAAL